MRFEHTWHGRAAALVPIAYNITTHKTPLFCGRIKQAPSPFTEPPPAQPCCCCCICLFLSSRNHPESLQKVFLKGILGDLRDLDGSMARCVVLEDGGWRSTSRLGNKLCSSSCFAGSPLASRRRRLCCCNCSHASPMPGIHRPSPPTSWPSPRAIGSARWRTAPTASSSTSAAPDEATASFSRRNG